MSEVYSNTESLVGVLYQNYKQFLASVSERKLFDRIAMDFHNQPFENILAKMKGQSIRQNG